MLRASLSILNSTDFRTYGVNESGFKAMVVAQLLPLLVRNNKEMLHSEVRVEGGYIDLVVLFPKFKAALIIELKYLQLLFFKGVPWFNLSDEKSNLKPSEKRQLLDKYTEPFKKLKVDDLKVAWFRNPKTKLYNTTIYDCVINAAEQAKDYAKSLKEGGLLPFNPRPTNIHYSVIVGAVCTNVHHIK